MLLRKTENLVFAKPSNSNSRLGTANLLPKSITIRDE